MFFDDDFYDLNRDGEIDAFEFNLKMDDLDNELNRRNIDVDDYDDPYDFDDDAGDLFESGSDAEDYWEDES